MWTQRRSGQTHQRGQHDHRKPYERDRTRVIHCPAFRRLQRKTQILGMNEGDFHRTRLTHSLEVASIGVSIVHSLARQSSSQFLSGLLPQDDLMYTICLLHDIGHPPFGHGGEVALNYMMREYGGFEGNGQTLRLLTKVEDSYGPYGLDLTRRALLGILKYPVARHVVVARKQLNEIPHVKPICVNDWLPPKAYFDSESEEVAWLIAPFEESDRMLFQSLAINPTLATHGRAAFHGFDCSIMNIADDIAYGVHDLEDAIHLRLIRREQLDTPECRALIKASSIAHPKLLDALFSDDLCARKEAIGEMVNYFITAVQVQETHPDFASPLLKFNARLSEPARAWLDELTACIYRTVIDSQEARAFEYGGQMVILRLFEAISANPNSLLDLKNRELFQASSDQQAAQRVVCDYIANMTDEYAYRFHERLFGLNTRTIFERL
jgi:dGTPase